MSLSSHAWDGITTPHYYNKMRKLMRQRRAEIRERITEIRRLEAEAAEMRAAGRFGRAAIAQEDADGHRAMIYAGDWGRYRSVQHFLRTHKPVKYAAMSEAQAERMRETHA